MTSHPLSIDEADHGQRLDKWLSAELSDYSRSRLQGLIREGCLSIDDIPITNPSAKLTAAMRHARLTIPPVEDLALAPVPMELEILYEDDALLVINKPAGLTVHPAPGERNATLVHGLLAHCGDSLSGIGGVARPGIVHRLDKDTSGAIIVAKHDAAHKHLSAQLKDRSLSRTYHALCYGVPKAVAGVIDGAIGRHPKHRKKMAVLPQGEKDARTHYRVLERLAGDTLSLIECRLETGRTHQIRVHLTHIGHPLLGDSTYGRARKLADEDNQALIHPLTQQMLHAVALSFIHPISGETITCNAPYREEFATLLKALQ